MGSSTVAGQWIDIAAADGGTFKGYLTVPASGSGPGILLLQEIFGVNSSMREVADYYAEEGYVVLAPDLFWRLEPGIELGYSEADFNKAFGYYQRFDANQSIKDAADALKVLRARPECVGKVGARLLPGRQAGLSHRGAHRCRLLGLLLRRRHRGRPRRGLQDQVPDG